MRISDWSSDVCSSDLILLLKGGTCCVLQNISRGHADILLPEAGGTSKTVAVAALQEQYAGYAFFARTEARFDERAPETTLAGPPARLWGTPWPFWPLYNHVLMASVLLHFFAIPTPDR